MSKQKKEKQPPVLGRLLEYAGGHRWLSVLGCGLSGVSAAAGIFPFVFVWYAARGILTPGGGVPVGLARYGWYALAAALLSAAIYFAGLMCTHLAAFRVATNMRKAAVAHLVDLPLGYFNAIILDSFAGYYLYECASHILREGLSCVLLPWL